MERKNVTAIVLAAGLGTRMVSDIPKVLHKLGSYTILDRVLKGLNKAGILDIIVVVGNQKEQIKLYCKNYNVRFVVQKKLLGSADAVLSVLNAKIPIKDNILITCADAPLISSNTFINLVNKQKKTNAFCSLLTCKVENPFSYGRIIKNEKNEILEIIEQKDLIKNQELIKEVNVGTYCLKKQGLNKLLQAIKINKKKKEFYFTDIIKILREKNKKVITQTCTKEEFIGINSRKDLLKANKILNNRKIQKLMDSGVTIIDSESVFIDEDVVIGKDTIIFPNTIIESNVKIGKGCKIGPFARIRSDSKINHFVEIGNFVEICRTNIDNYTKIKHHSYLGDTIVGKNVNIGAGTITANYDGKNKNKTHIKDNAFIGVGVILIAPIKVGKNAKVGAGSVVTKNKNVPDNSIVVGVPAKPF